MVVDVVDDVAAAVVVGVEAAAGQPSVIDPTVTPTRVLQPTRTLAVLLPLLVGNTLACTVLPVWVTEATDPTSMTVLDCC